MAVSNRDREGGPPEGKHRVFSLVKSKARKRDSSFLFWFILVLVLWSPWIVACFPGSNSTDILAQISQFLGHRPYSNHHPVFSTVVFGSVYSLGMFAGGIQGGQVALLLFQVACSACCVALAARWMIKAGVRRRIVWAITLFIGIVPVFPMFAQWLVKNTLAAGMMYLFAVQILLLAISFESGRRPLPAAQWWAIALTGVLCCLMRNDSVFMVAPTLLVAVLVFWKQAECRQAALLGGGFVIAFNLAWMLIVLPGLNVATSNPREMLSLPIQQLAYTIKHDPLYFEGGLGNKIDELLIDGRSVQTVGQSYREKVSDPVKKQFRFESAEEVASFLRIWAKVGHDHRGMYAEAAAIHTRGYWNPFMERSGYCEVNNIGELYTVAAKGTQYEDRFEGAYELFPQAKALCRKAVSALWMVPGLAWLGNPAFYVWACLIAGVALLVFRKPSAVLLVLVLCVVGICCLSPLCGSLRYALVLCYLAPLLAGCLFIEFPKAPKSAQADESALS